MLHCRSDYNRIQDPALNDSTLLSPGSSAIGSDEPVFLLRAKDKLAPVTLRWWASMLQAESGDPETVSAVLRWADAMERWAEKNGSKVPGTPRDCLT